MKTFAEWLEEFRRKITDAVQRDRFDEELVGHIFDEEKLSNYIFQRSGPDKVETLPEGGTTITLAPLRTEVVEPERIRIKADLGDWAYDPQYTIMGIYLDDMARL